jgi:hypothetical protein
MKADQTGREGMNKAVLNAIPGLVFIQDSEGTFLEWRGDPRNLRMEPEPFLGRRFRDVFPKQFADLVEGHILGTLDHGSGDYFEYELEDSSGIQRFFECRMVPFEPGKVLSLIAEKSGAMSQKVA